MVETLRRPTPPESLKAEPVETEQFRQFWATFDRLATLMKEGRFGTKKKIQLTQIKNHLWEQHERGLLGKFPSEEDEFKNMVEVIVGGAHYSANLIEGELITVSRERKGRNVRLYSSEEIGNLGIIAWFYLKDVKANPKEDRKAGRWGRIKDECRRNSPELFPSQTDEAPVEEPRLPLEMTAEELKKRCIYLSLITRGREFNTVDADTFTGGEMKWVFVKKARWL